MSKKASERQSGIELLKLFLMFLIVIAHVIQSVGQRSADNPVFNGNIIDLCRTTDNIQFFLMALIWNFVMFAVDVFFVSSAWFLTDSKGIKRNKVMAIIADVWIISVIFLVCFLVGGVPVSGKLIIKSLLPTIFSNNWFITCYLILYLIHPLLNIVIKGIDERAHRIVVLTGLFGYCIITAISEYLLFYSKILVIMIIYLTVAYVKKYMAKRADDPKINGLLFTVSFAINFAVICMINIFGGRIGFLQGMLMHSNTIQNPFLIVMAITSFNLFRNMSFHNEIVNSMAGLTLYVYIIHENILFRTYARPWIWDRLLKSYGYEHILACAVCFAVFIYVCSFAAGKLYYMTVGRIIGHLLKKHESKSAVRL